MPILANSRFLALVLGGALSTSCATGQPQVAQNDNNKMINLDGQDPVFAAGRKTFHQAKARCFDAVIATFRNTGHGVDRTDLEAGQIVSGKRTVYHGTTRTTAGFAETRVDNKFYVSVKEDGTGCAVSVDKLRVWSNAREVDTRTLSWLKSQLGGFIRGVEQELAEPPLDRWRNHDRRETTVPRRNVQVSPTGASSLGSGTRTTWTLQ